MSKRKAPIPGNTKAWIEQNADRLDYPDSIPIPVSEIAVPAPAETYERLKDLTMGLLPDCRYYLSGTHLYRVHRAGNFASYNAGEWLTIEGATLRLDRVKEITVEAVRRLVEKPGNPGQK